MFIHFHILNCPNLIKDLHYELLMENFLLHFQLLWPKLGSWGVLREGRDSAYNS